MTKRKKFWSKTVIEHGLEFRIYERANSSNLWYQIRRGGRKERKSLKTADRDLAEQRVKEIANVLKDIEINGPPPDRPTLGQVFQVYREEKVPTLSESWGKAAETRIGLFEEAWGPGMDVLNLSQSHVDRYVVARRAGTLSPLGRGGRGDRKPRKVRDGTLDADFRWLSSVFNFARRHRVRGERLLHENPLHDVTWPKEKNPRRPVASHQRFVATMKHVDAVDPDGRLRCILALARFTGRRESAICELQSNDVLRDQEVIRAALAAAGMDERIAEHMPHGAIRWREATDKQGLLFIAPLGEDARAEVDRYLRTNPRVGSAPLFPAPEDPTKPLRRDVASSWLLKAEKAAELPKLKGGVFHPYRRLWATERKHLPDADVAAAGGWKDTRALQLSHQQADPATVLRVVEGG